MRPLRLLPLVLLLGGTLALTSCETPPGGESELPWNMPQNWEGSPGIPGLNER